MLSLPDQLAGCKVFPVVPGGKLPATANGWKEASNDAAQIAAWHAVNPEFNWAIACGLNGLFVFDIDPVGLDWWSKLLERNPAIKAAVDAAFQVRTPRGGLHVYFRGEGPSTASRIADGIDTRGGFLRDGEIASGGYVVLPGSRTDKGAYEALPGGVIAPLPSFMAALVPERKKTDTLGLVKNPDADKPRNIQWAIDLLKGYVESGCVSIEGRGGNNLAFQVACSILDKAISPGMAFDLLWEHWNPACSPPWDEWELENIVRNAAEYGEDTSGGVKGFLANEEAFAHFAGQEFEPKPLPQRDRILALHDYADGVSDPEWLIPDILPAQGAGMLYGESGSYKSFITLDMALCLAFGISGQWNAPPVKNDVLFLAGEGPIAVAKKRWPAWMQAHDIEFRNDHRFFIKNRVPLFSDKEGWDQVKKDLALLAVKPAFIVIDTLSRLIVGMNENEAKDMTMATEFAEQLARYYECFVLLIHHTGKDQSKGARGSSALYANLDVVLSTRRIPPNGMEFRVRKQKDADVREDGLQFEIQEIGASIFLKRAEGLKVIEQKTGKPRFAWADVSEIVKILGENGGEVSHSVLLGLIAGKYFVDKKLIHQQLRANADALAFLRPNKDIWAIPKQEYDL